MILLTDTEKEIWDYLHKYFKNHDESVILQGTINLEMLDDNNIIDKNSFRSNSYTLHKGNVPKAYYSINRAIPKKEEWEIEEKSFDFYCKVICKEILKYLESLPVGTIVRSGDLNFAIEGNHIHDIKLNFKYIDELENSLSEYVEKKF